MSINRFPLVEMKNKVAESAEQDQIARMCRLILFYTVRKFKWLTNAQTDFEWLNGNKWILVGRN